MPHRLEDFEAQRRHLRALAYRMLGSRAEAEDVVQDCWLRWRETLERGEAIEQPQAWLSRVATNLCLDRLTSAQARREAYVGVWLPEPLVNDAHEFDAGPEARLEYAQDVSIAFMLTLERLSPLERAAFLLHDVFDLGFSEIASRLGRSAAACRQLASRARARVQAGQVKVDLADEEAMPLLMAFAQAVQGGDVEGLAGLLAAEVQFLADGGGKAAALPRPLVGAERVAKALVGFAKLWDRAALHALAARINGLPGVVLRDAENQLHQTLAVQLGRAADGSACIAAIYVTRNPEKLAGA